MKLVTFILRHKFYAFLIIFAGILLFDFLFDGFTLTWKVAGKDLVMSFFEFVGIVTMAEAAMHSRKVRLEQSGK